MRRVGRALSDLCRLDRSEGGTRRGNGALARGVPPGRQSAEGIVHVESSNRARRVQKITTLSTRLTHRRRRAALRAARLVTPLPAWSPTAIPWRERPPEMAAWPAKSAASDAVAHATAERVLAPCVSAVGQLEAAKNPTRDLNKNLMNFSAVFSQWSQHPDWNG